MFVAVGAAERLRNTERKDFLENRWPDIVSHMRRWASTWTTWSTSALA